VADNETMNIMCDKQLLVGYLYDEIDAVERRAIEAHLASCVACREEVVALGATRRQIAAWTPPERQLDFQIVSGAARPARVPWFGVSPAWGLAAAAVLVLAAAAAIANVEVRYDDGGFAVRTGWSRAASAAPPPAADVAAGPALTPAAWTEIIDTLERRLRELEAARPAQEAVTASAAGPRVSEAAVLRQVRELLNESETRQNRELAFRIRQLATDINAQRRVDLATIQRGLQGATGAEAAQRLELLNYVNGLYRVSLQSK
jgi:putative zinc finger protein